MQRHPTLIFLGKTGIDGKTAGATEMFTTDSNRTFYPLFTLYTVTAIGTMSVLPTISTGSNAAAYNNLHVATALLNLAAVGTMQRIDPATTAASIAGGTAVSCNITVGAVGTGVFTLTAGVIGFYL